METLIDLIIIGVTSGISAGCTLFLLAILYDFIDEYNSKRKVNKQIKQNGNKRN